MIGWYVTYLFDVFHFKESLQNVLNLGLEGMVIPCSWSESKFLWADKFSIIAQNFGALN